MMHAEAKNPNCAYMWLEHSLNKKLQGDLSAWFGSVPVVLEACKGNPLLGEKGCEERGLASFDKIHFWRTPTAKCASQNDQCVPYHRWATDYIAVIGGR
jgi:spermidine/putrescine-binding protein